MNLFCALFSLSFLSVARLGSLEQVAAVQLIAKHPEYSNQVISQLLQHDEC